MKIKTWIKYEESYIPPRCRKPRYNECEEYVNINLSETTGSTRNPTFIHTAGTLIKSTVNLTTNGIMHW